MNVQEFFEAYLDLWVETNKSSDTSTLDQCIDAWRTFNRKVVGAPDIFGNPPDIWANYQADFYDKIPYTPDGVPKLGDVIVWGIKYEKYGHIAICTDIADTKTFTSFDQNDPTGSNCHYQPHTYSGVLGWLRPKKDVVGHPDEKTALEILKEIPHEGNLEGLVRQLAGEHQNYPSLESKAKQLDGFVAKWVEEYKLTEGSNLVEIEGEMGKLLLIENRVNKLREAIEGCVGAFEDDSALLGALQAVRSDKEKLSDQLADCQLKLSNRKVLWAFEIGKFTIKIYKNK